MDYTPEKNNIRILITGSLLFFDLIVIALFLMASSLIIRGLLIFLFLLMNLYGSYNLILLLSLRFRLTEKEFAISAALNLKRVRIPVEDIISWTRRITLLENVGTSLHTARFALGKGLDSYGESADLFITSSKKSIFLKTKRGNFGISPEKADDFIAQLKQLGIPQQSGSERQFMNKDHQDGKTQLNQLTVYCIVLTAILLILPVLMHFTNLLPSWVPLSQVEYITHNAYLESVFVKGLIAIVLIVLTYGIIVLLSATDGRYYYRIMFAPLIFVVLTLFLEINTHLNILLNT